MKKMLIGMSLFIWGCDQSSEAIPEMLQGIWKTSQEDYAGTFLELKEKKITFGTGSGECAEYDIIQVESAMKDYGLQYAIQYAGEDGKPMKFFFLYEPEDGGAIRLKSKSGFAWEKIK